MSALYCDASECVLPAGHAGDHTDDGAPIYGGVTDPAGTSGPGIGIGYRPPPIAACPECLGDCQSEGRDGWYCPACRANWTWQQVAYFEDGDPDD
jgi:hypothetical protein